MKANLVAALVGVNLVYACESIFTKLASAQAPFSPRYILYMGCAVAVLGLYALAWQQILRRAPVSEAYMFKGSSLVFVMLLSALLFAETITVGNICGAVMIIGGIALFAKV